MTYLIAYLILINSLLTAYSKISYGIIPFILIYIFFYFLSRKIIFIHKSYFIILITIIGMFIFIILNNELEKVLIFNYIMYLYAFFAAYWLFSIDKYILMKVSYMTLMTYYLYFICFGIFYGFSPVDINTYMPYASRNQVSAYAIFLQILYTASYYRVNKKLPLFTSLFTFILCILAFGRSGILCSGLIFIFSFFLLLFNGSKEQKKILKIILFFLIFLCVLQVNYIFDYISNYSSFQQGLESPRNLMNQQYLDELDFQNLLLGINLNLIPEILNYNLNPHNTFILGHSHFGLINIILFFVIVCISSLIYLVWFKKIYVYVFLLMIFFLRIYFDVFMEHYFLMLLLFLFILESKKNQKIYERYHYE